MVDGARGEPRDSDGHTRTRATSCQGRRHDRVARRDEASHYDVAHGRAAELTHPRVQNHDSRQEHRRGFHQQKVQHRGRRVHYGGMGDVRGIRLVLVYILPPAQEQRCRQARVDTQGPELVGAGDRGYRDVRYDEQIRGADGERVHHREGPQDRGQGHDGARDQIYDRGVYPLQGHALVLDELVHRRKGRTERAHQHEEPHDKDREMDQGDVGVHVQARLAIRSFRSMHEPSGKRVYTSKAEELLEPKIRTGVVEVHGDVLSFTDSDGATRTIRCSYGIGRMTQVRHMAVFKQHFPRPEPPTTLCQVRYSLTHRDERLRDRGHAQHPRQAAVLHAQVHGEYMITHPSIHDWHRVYKQNRLDVHGLPELRDHGLPACRCQCRSSPSS
ncbi:hypothetical protein F5B21DRAFT_87682 [Xylaria acuta]|nr:hypothetical protein F5B21DRAFT_87682 [Xylaria acuta]